MPSCTNVHTHARGITPQAQLCRGFHLPGASRCSLGKSILQLLGNPEEGGRLGSFFSLLDTNPHNACPCAFLSLCLCVSISLGHHRLLLFAWKGSRERGGRREAQAGAGILGPLGSAPHTGPGSCAAQWCSRWKQLRMTVAIDYGKIVCG